MSSSPKKDVAGGMPGMMPGMMPFMGMPGMMPGGMPMPGGVPPASPIPPRGTKALTAAEEEFRMQNREKNRQIHSGDTDGVRYIARVKNWALEKGFGFGWSPKLADEFPGGDVFLHRCELDMSIRDDFLVKDMLVSFEVVLSAMNKPQARDILVEREAEHGDDVPRLTRGPNVEELMLKGVIPCGGKLGTGGGGDRVVGKGGPNLGGGASPQNPMNMPGKPGMPEMPMGMPGMPMGIPGMPMMMPGLAMPGMPMMMPGMPPLPGMLPGMMMPGMPGMPPMMPGMLSGMLDGKDRSPTNDGKAALPGIMPGMGMPGLPGMTPMPGMPDPTGATPGADAKTLNDLEKNLETSTAGGGSMAALFAAAGNAAGAAAAAAPAGNAESNAAAPAGNAAGMPGNLPPLPGNLPTSTGDPGQMPPPPGVSAGMPGMPPLPVSLPGMPPPPGSNALPDAFEQLDPEELIRFNRAQNEKGDGHSVAGEVNRFTAMLTRGLLDHRERVAAVEETDPAVGMAQGGTLAHLQFQNSQMTQNQNKTIHDTFETAEYDLTNAVATADKPDRDRDRRSSRSRDRKRGRRDYYRDRDDDRSREDRGGKDRDRGERDRRVQDKPPAYTDTSKFSAPAVTDQTGKLVAVRGKWAEYVHSQGTYWVHVVTRERSDVKPTDFEVRASRDSSGRARGGTGVPGGLEPNCIYVQNIPNTWSPHELRQHFSSFGTIVACDIPDSQAQPGSGLNRGYGFVTFCSAEEAKQAQLAMHAFCLVDEGGDMKRLQVAIRGQNKQPANIPAGLNPSVITDASGNPIGGTLGGSVGPGGVAIQVGTLNLPAATLQMPSTQNVAQANAASCIYWKMGKCGRGANCHFKHEPSEFGVDAGKKSSS